MRGVAAVIPTRARHCDQDEAIPGQGRGAPQSLRLHAARTGVLALLMAATLAGAPASARPLKIDDCEAIKDANAYNLCLASFGPTRGQHGAAYPGVASEGEKRGGGASRGKRAAARDPGPAFPAGASLSRGGGRVRMEFTPRR